jgi:hypothetical protein
MAVPRTCSLSAGLPGEFQVLLGRHRCGRREIPHHGCGAVAGIPAVTACGDTLTFADPGVLARAPIAGENDSSWLGSRQQLNVLNFGIVGGKLRWKAQELSIGQPLAAAASYLWTVRLTDPQDAYAGKRAVYEIDQVGSFSGKIVRSWAYPGSGVDLTAYRWRAELRGSTCVLHRLEALPDETVNGNTSPPELALARIMGAPKRKSRFGRKLATSGNVR